MNIFVVKVVPLMVGLVPVVALLIDCVRLVLGTCAAVLTVLCSSLRELACDGGYYSCSTGDRCDGSCGPFSNGGRCAGGCCLSSNGGRCVGGYGPPVRVVVVVVCPTTGVAVVIARFPPGVVGMVVIARWGCCNGVWGCCDCGDAGARCVVDPCNLLRCCRCGCNA